MSETELVRNGPLRIDCGAAQDRLPRVSHVLRQAAGISLTVTMVGKPRDPKTARGTIEKNDLVFKRDVGAPPAAPVSQPSSAAGLAANSRCCEANAARNARRSALSGRVGRPNGVNTSSGARVEGMAWSRGAQMRLADRVASSAIAAITAGRWVLPNVGAGTARIEHGSTSSAAKVLLRSIFGSQVVAKLLLHACAIVSNSAAMLGIVLPVGGLGPAVHIDLTASPAELPAPIASTRHPSPERVCRAEGNSARDAAATNLSYLWVVVIGRVVGMGPFTINNRRIVVGHVHGLRVCRLDCNDLMRLLDLLFLRRCQLLGAVGLGSQALNGIHDIRLLSEHGVSQLLRPVEFGVHHR